MIKNLNSLLLVLFIFSLCGCEVTAPLAPKLELYSDPTVSPQYPIDAGFFIDSQTKEFIHAVEPQGLVESSTEYRFKIGQPLTELFLGVSEVMFQSVVPVESLPGPHQGPQDNLKAYISITSLKVEMDTKVENQASYLVLGSTFLAKLFNKKFFARSVCSMSAVLSFYGEKGDLIETAKLEAAANERHALKYFGRQPEKFSKAPEKAMELLAGELLTSLRASDKIRLYVASKQV